MAEMIPATFNELAIAAKEAQDGYEAANKAMLVASNAVRVAEVDQRKSLEALNDYVLDCLP